MPLLTRIARRLRRRRAEVDRVWREATRAQDAEYQAAVERIRAAGESHGEAVDRRTVLDTEHPPHRRYRGVWVDTGSGPGYEMLLPCDEPE